MTVKIKLLFGMLLCCLGVLTAAGADYMDPKLWVGTCNQGQLPPEIKKINSPKGPAITAVAVENGEWQGMKITLSEPVDLRKVGKITFDFEQNAYGNSGSMAFMFGCVDGGGLLANPKFKASGWASVTLPIDARTLQGLGQSTPPLGPINQITITLYNNFSKAGTHMTIANLKFHPKVEGDAPLPIVGYSYLTAPTSGDTDRSYLTDGVVNEKKQAYFREYSDNPDITFDLGAVCRISKFTLSAVAIPSQNAAGVELYTSYDGKKWHLSKHIACKDNGTEKKQYTISEDKMGIVGRFVRVHVLRNRTDFQVYLGEISFEGRIPTQEELAAASEEQYDLGPAMPEISSAKYYTLDSGDGRKLYICKATGVAVAYEKDGHRLAERIFSRYELSDGKTPVKSNSYNDKVIKVNRTRKDTIEVLTRNKDLPGITFSHIYSWKDGDLAIGLQFKSNRSDKKILFTATEVVIPKELRRGGLYETWGAGHDMQHKFSDEITLELPADTGPVMVFESPKTPLTLLHCRYMHNGRYVQIGSGVITVAGFGDKRTLFTPTGWVVGDGLFALTEKGAQGRIESRLICAQGDLTAAYDRYLACPEVKEFRSSIHRPDWLKDVRFFGGAVGWDAPWGNNLLRGFEYASAMIREGVFPNSVDVPGFRWGDFPTSGDVGVMRGGRMSVEEAVEMYRQIKEKTRCKIGIYTWLWSVAWNSDIFKQHPEWFIRYNAQGKESSFFPGWSKNFPRLISAPGHTDTVVDQIMDVEKTYECDLWYLDGGGSPSAIDWPTMRIDDPDAWDQLYVKLRKKLQEYNPDHVIFFNHPENPLADFGYFESYGGVMTNKWRDGATWMYKFKLWQRHDPLHSSLYIYWLSDVDRAMRHYAIGTGLGLTFYTMNLRPEVAYMGAQQQSRWTRLVDADISPNWRYEPEENLEIMPLTLGDNGAWLFMNTHGTEKISRQVSADSAALNMTDPTRPIYHWYMGIIPHSEHKGLLTESEREANYTNSRWQSDFVVRTRFLGVTDYQKRISREFSFVPNEAGMWAVTQSPAVVYSVDNMRNQLWMPDTMGVKVDGLINGDTINLTVKSQRKTAEVVSVLPAGKCVKSVTVNGAPAALYDTINLYGTPMALVQVGNGDSKIEIQLAPAAAAQGNFDLTIQTAAPGKNMTLTINGNSQADLLASIYSHNDLVWSSKVKPGNVDIQLPVGVTGGEYKAVISDLNGKALAESKFTLAAGTPKYQMHQNAEIVPQDDEKIEINKEFKDRSFTLLNGVKTVSRNCGDMQLDVDNAQFKLMTNYRPQSRWFLIGGAYEMLAKRYIKIRLDGNLGEHNREDDITGVGGLGTNYDMEHCFLGLTFDFATGDLADSKYTTRTLGSLGLAWPYRVSPEPRLWGTGKLAEIINIVSNFGIETEDSQELWLDLEEIGAPMDWNGKLYFGVMYQSGSPDRKLNITLLESCEELPNGASAQKIYPLKDPRVKIEQKVVKLPKVAKAPVIDGKADEIEWKTAPSFTDLTGLGQPNVKSPETEFRILRDAKNLYVTATLAQKNFNKDKNLLAWMCDGVEIWLERRDSKGGVIQIVLGSNGLHYSKNTIGSGDGAVVNDIVPKYAQSEVPGKLTFEAAIPLDWLGSGKEVSGFNFARTVRAEDGQGYGSYTLAPGRKFKNFEYYAFDWQ